MIDSRSPLLYSVTKKDQFYTFPACQVPVCSLVINFIFISGIVFIDVYMPSPAPPPPLFKKQIWECLKTDFGPVGCTMGSSGLCECLLYLEVRVHFCLYPAFAAWSVSTCHASGPRLNMQGQLHGQTTCVVAQGSILDLMFSHCHLDSLNFLQGLCIFIMY